jgi:CBS domain-containing protein
MNAADVMTHAVVTATPDTTVEELARRMLANRISALPILDGTALIGIVSEGDLLRRQLAENGAHRPHPLQELLGNRDSLAVAYVHDHGRVARDLMTTPVVTVDASLPVSEVAALLQTRRIKRVPVTQEGLLVGIVARADLLRALACHPSPPAAHRGDAQIRAAVLAELSHHRWGTLPGEFSIIVRDGVVHLWGLTRSEEQHRAVVVAAASVPGVQDVRDHLGHYSPPDPLFRPNWPSPGRP